MKSVSIAKERGLHDSQYTNLSLELMNLFRLIRSNLADSKRQENTDVE